MTTYWWLSFCDVTKPEGSQFLMAGLFEGATFAEAVEHSLRRGAPVGDGIECAGGGPIPAEAVPEDQPLNRMMSFEEIDTLGNPEGGEAIRNADDPVLTEFVHMEHFK